MILIIDNYDSFTYNILQYVGEVSSAKQEILVKRNDQIKLAEIIALKPSHIIISPGPCTPNESGVSLQVIEYFKDKIPLLGICLGHQAIAQVFGGHIIRDKTPLHGKTSQIIHQQQSIFNGITSPFTATRYHSLIVERETLPDFLEILAETADQTIMALRHRDFPNVIGVQFHPESILTEKGKDLLTNFLAIQA
ncbi:MAG: aminodeoxychorismate/anthranilate synthase component II [Proteobacteria bacterium]|nr:aminodeoxychorismate/anthranilate synthase component II [Pseudomonadota bacterium]